MIDRETSIQWAKDAGFGCETGFYCSNTGPIQALITRAQSEAFEKAASICNGMMTPKETPEDYESWCQGTNDAADRIRALKEQA